MILNQMERFQRRKNNGTRHLKSNSDNNKVQSPGLNSALHLIQTFRVLIVQIKLSVLNQALALLKFPPSNTLNRITTTQIIPIKTRTKVISLKITHQTLLVKT
jgi:hypothetical protein